MGFLFSLQFLDAKHNYLKFPVDSSSLEFNKPASPEPSQLHSNGQDAHSPGEAQSYFLKTRRNIYHLVIFKNILSSHITFF